MICTCIQNKTYGEILDLLQDLEMAEIRLDLCALSDEEITELFAQTDIPLIATCRAAHTPGQDGIPSPGWSEAERKLTLAVQAGARFADLEIEAPSEVSRRFQKLCRECGTELIRSCHDFEGTPDEKGLQMALARCFRYGADIAKIVTMCHTPEDAARIEGLYSIILEDVDSLQGRLIAFGMGEEGRNTPHGRRGHGPGAVHHRRTHGPDLRRHRRFLPQRPAYARLQEFRPARHPGSGTGGRHVAPV